MSETRITQFVHIEKNAGTSVRAALEQSVGPNHVYVYSPQADRFAPSSASLQPQTSAFVEQIRHIMDHPVMNPIMVRLWQMVNSYYKHALIRRYPSKVIPTDAKVVMGHFKADQFESLFEDGTRPIRSIVVRNPYDRMRSHYAHWKRIHGLADWRVRIPFSSNICFENFAMRPELCNYQTQALGDLDLEDFDVVGVTEQTELFIQRLLTKLSSEGVIYEFPGTTSQRLNVTSHKKPQTTESNNDLEFQEKFRVAHALDFNLYEEALSQV